jgi:cytochrome b561
MIHGLIGTVIAGFVAVNIGVALFDHFMRKDWGLMRVVSG